MKTLTFSILLMSAAAAFANEAADERMNHGPFEGQLTRAQVASEYLSARAEGTLPDTSEIGSAHAQVTDATRIAATLLTRAQVVAEFIRARADGTLVDTSEVGAMHAPTLDPGRGRAPAVYAEAVVAAHDAASE